MPAHHVNQFKSRKYCELYQKPRACVNHFGGGSSAQETPPVLPATQFVTRHSIRAPPLIAPPTEARQFRKTQLLIAWF